MGVHIEGGEPTSAVATPRYDQLCHPTVAIS